VSQQRTLPGVDLSLDAYVTDAIKLLRQMQPIDQPYYGCFSGGKDSCVIKELGRLAGINAVWHYNVTTIDPPELVRFIRKEAPSVIWHRQERSMFAAIIAKGFPTRQNRWCCERYKERISPPGSRLILGVRAAESPRRAKIWLPVTYHSTRQTVAVCPILGWSDDQVWAFIDSRGLAYCCLYDEGFDRLGCIGCPMSGAKGIARAFERWPGYKKQYERAFRLLWERRQGDHLKDGRLWFGEENFGTWQEMFDWWCRNEPAPGKADKCQGLIELFS
jgi:phosphoadenosine phosphosulfate reductase